jgi:hypothetical protein
VVDELRESLKTRFGFPIVFIHQMLQRGDYAEPVYLAAVLEYQVAELLIKKAIFNLLLNNYAITYQSIRTS